MIGKLLYLYEGWKEKDGRWELPHVFYLGGLYGGSAENHRLSHCIQKYIETNYETKYLKRVEARTVFQTHDGGIGMKESMNAN